MKKHLIALTALATFAIAAGSATADARTQMSPMAQAGHYIVKDNCNKSKSDCDAIQAFVQGSLATLGGIVGMVGGPVGAVVLGGLGAL